MRNRFANNVVGRPKMKRHRFFEIGAPHVRERADFNDAGIVDHNIEAAEMIDDFFHRLLDLRRLEQIAFDRQCITAPLL